ncbi:MAG: NDP-sugar synthase [Candidatus Saganbacteria bacterium]|nr:NDP-sugar synthase [Candidatus Saganbacteria bacterium]
MKAVIIAGGFGTRLRPLTYNLPKPVVPIVNVPLVLHQIGLLVRHGIKDIILNLHYLPESIKMILNKEHELGVNLDFSIEERPLGTCGAVKNASQFFDNEPLLVFNGDTLSDINLTALIEEHKRKKAKATITLTRVPDPSLFGLVVTDKDGRVTEFIEKPTYQKGGLDTINAGVYLLDPKLFDKIPAGQNYSFERQLFPDLIKSKQTFYAYISDSYWIDIGNPEKYKLAQKDILRGRVNVSIRGKKEGANWIGNDCIIDPSALLEGPVLIGDGVIIDEKAAIQDETVLGEKVRVGQESRVEGSIIWRNTVIGEQVRLHDCIIGANCIIEDFVNLDGAIIGDHSIIKKGSRF